MVFCFFSAFFFLVYFPPQLGNVTCAVPGKHHIFFNSEESGKKKKRRYIPIGFDSGKKKTKIFI